MRELLLSEDFKQRRKEQGTALSAKIRSNPNDYSFRRNRYHDYLYQLFQVYSVIGWNDLKKSQETGYVELKAPGSQTVSGALYSREYDWRSSIVKWEQKMVNGYEKEDRTYDIELFVKKSELENMSNVILSIGECLGSTYTFAVDPENTPDNVVFVWDSGKERSAWNPEVELRDLLLEEFGQESKFYSGNPLGRVAAIEKEQITEFIKKIQAPKQ